MMSKKTLMVFLVLFTLAMLGTDGAPDTGMSKKSSTSVTRSKSESTDQMKQKTESDTISRGGTISVTDIFFPAIASLEEKLPPFSECKLITKPPRPADVGYRYEVAPGKYDTTLKSVLDTRSAAFGQVDDQTNEALQRIRLCMLTYGAIIAEGALYLKSKMPEGRKEDLIQLASVIAEKIARRGLSNKTIRSIYEEASRENTRCRFNSGYDSFVCGSFLLDVTGMTLAQGYLLLYGRGALYGYNVFFTENHVDASSKVRAIVLTEQKLMAASSSIEMTISLPKETR